MPRHLDPRVVEERPERARGSRREPEPVVPGAHDAASLALLARSSPSGGAELMRSLQHGVGNASVQAMLSQVPEDAGQPAPTTETTVERYAFEAEIPRGPAPEAGREAVAGGGRSDAPAGMEEDPIGAVAAVVGGAVASAPEEAPPAGGAAVAAPAAAEPGSQEAAGPEEEITVSLPDIEVPALAGVAKTDAVNPAFSYSGSIERGGAAPAGFGVTHSFDSKLTGVTTTLKKKVYKVKATLEHPIKWEVRSGTGPDGQVDIASETDADITDLNYGDVVSDLTPDMTDLNGRPPRNDFWAEDLTIRHEKVHAADDKKNGPGAMRVTSKWLSKQTAASVADVTTLLGEIPDRFAAALLAALSTEAGEKHAYGDGAPSYKRRAKAIKKRGDAGKYP